jgi:hypothetical protein
MRTMFKAVLVAAVVGTSALASAAPCNDVTVTQPVAVVTQQPAPIITTPIVYQQPHAGWVNLSGGMQLKGEDVVSVGRDRGKFDKIEIVGGFDRSETTVKKVSVTFGDGQVETVRLDRTLTPGNNAVQIQLDGTRFIKSVAITGASHGRGVIQVRGLEV